MKLTKWLIIFLIIIINYNSGRTEIFKNVKSYYQDSSNVYIIIRGEYFPRIIPKKLINSWEIKNE